MTRLLLLLALWLVPRDVQVATPHRSIMTWYTSRDDTDVTACGGRVHDGELHAAFRDAPCGERLKLTSPITHRWVIVTSDDFGPNAVARDYAVTDPAWDSVYLNRTHHVWSPTEAFLRGCRHRPEGCAAPHGFYYLADVDTPPGAWGRMGLDPRWGRTEVLIERLGRARHRH